MEDKEEEGFEIERKDFDEVIKKFESKTTKSYDFLLKSGEKYKQAMFKLCKKMIESEEFPESFKKTLLYMIWGKKGPAEVLKKSRFIHMKEGFLARTCEALAVGKMKDCILKSSSKYQVGGQPGHSPEEHIFSSKSIWAMVEKEDEAIIITVMYSLAIYKYFYFIIFL